MSGEPQLERSVLEGKEREKLLAIAEALGLKPTARAKKADLIDGILRATGVESPPPADAEATKPKRTVRKRVAEAAPEAEAANGGNRPAAPPPFEERAASDPEPQPASAPSKEDPAAPPADEQPAPSAAAAEVGSEELAAAAVAEERADRNGERGAPSVSAPPRPQQQQSQPQRPAQQPQQGSAQDRAPQGQPGPGNQVSPSPGNQAQPAPGNHNQNQGQQNHQGNQQPPPVQPGQGTPVDGDVRRNRRRRGRDRDRAGYDQQAQQADQAYSGDPLPCDGLLELRPEGFGFLRTSGYLQGPDDVYVSTSQVRKFALRAGDRIVGTSRPATTQERFGALLRIDAVGEQSPEEARRRPRFEDLTPLFPDERLTLEPTDPADPADPATTTGRIIDLLAPLGKGQRGLIVSPPKTGKTSVMKHIAQAIEANHPDVDLMVLLVDERPEEVTDMRRSVKGEVIGSTFDRPAEEHTHLAELAIEVAKRRVELGRDVVVLLDGITRLTRSYNVAAPPTGRLMSGVLDTGALHPAKKLFGAARNVEEGGSLTILATALVETGSAMDTAIFEEFKGTGNMELRLDRRLAEHRMYPAIDVTASSTRHEELLLPEEELHLVWQLRRALVTVGRDGSADKGYEVLLDRLMRTRTNADFLAGLAGTSDDPLRLEGSL